MGDLSPRSGPRQHRELVRDEDGSYRIELKDVQKKFIEWLVDPERAAANTPQARFAEEHKLQPATLGKWKKDPHFIKEWERALTARNVNPDRIGRVIDAAYEKAVAGDVKAMELYMKLVDRMSPDKHLVVTQDLSSVSDEELMLRARDHLRALDS